jgi:hypothetical protein
MSFQFFYWEAYGGAPWTYLPFCRGERPAPDKFNITPNANNFKRPGLAKTALSSPSEKPESGWMIAMAPERLQSTT